jgi:F0F1-type ATP synthase assembly protein I
MNLAFAFSREDNVRRELTMTDTQAASHGVSKERKPSRPGRRVVIEAIWLMGSLILGFAFGSSTEYGVSAGPFFSILFLVIAIIVRVIAAVVRWTNS